MHACIEQNVLIGEGGEGLANIKWEECHGNFKCMRGGAYFNICPFSS